LVLKKLNGSKPLNLQIRDYVEDKIRTNHWKVGHLVPREMDLCRQFGVSRPTVRSALLHLVNSGYLTRIKGKGTFVSKPRLLEKSTLFIESFAEEMKDRGIATKTEVLEFRMIAAAEPVAGRLHVEKNQKVLKVTRLRYAERSFREGPIVLTTSYFPERLAHFIQKYDLEKTSIHHVLRENGIERTTFEKELGVKVLRGKECRLLGAEENSLAVFITSVVWDQDEKEMEYCESCYPADRNRFIVQIRL
jgi:GntR family transcriptional regulator